MAKGSVIKVKAKEGFTYAIRFYDTNGRRHYKTVGRKIDAERALRDMLSKVDSGAYRPTPDITFRELSVKWSELKSAEVRPKVAASYKSHVERLVDEFGSQKVKCISSEAVEQFANKLLGGNLSAATVGRNITILKSIFEAGCRWNYLSINPARYIKKPPVSKTEMDFFNPDELQVLIAATPERHRTLIMTACYSGMRQSEILAIRWSDVDFLSSRLFVRQVLQQGKFYPPKTELSKRGIIVPAVLMEALKAHQLRQLAELPANPFDLVFPNRSGNPMASRNLSSRIFEPALRVAGLRKVSFHALRHSYVSLLLSSGESIKLISRQVGHSSAKQTLDTYSHLLEGDAEAAMERLQSRLALA